MAIQTATNPQTGETVALVKNQWVPVSQTATNDKGQKAYLVNNQWLTDEIAAPPAKDAGFSLGDLGASFGIGAAGSTKALTDVAGAGNVLSSKLEGATESLQKSMTPERQAELKRQQARMKAAEESGSTLEEIKAAALNVAEAPLQSAAQAIGSFVPYLPALLASPVAAALGLTGRSLSVITSIAQKAPAVIGTAQGAGAVKGSIYEGVLKAEIESGVKPELAKQKATAAQDYFGKNFDQIALGSGLGYVAGTRGVEKLFTPAGRATVAPSTARRIGETVVKESVPEAAQGAQERVAQNIALQREGRDVETFKGAAGAATQEALTGALGAAPIAALSKPDTTIAAKKEQDKFEQEKEEFRKAYGEAKPVEVKEPEEPVEFPGGYTAIPRELSRQDVPESYGIFPEGSDKPLTTVKTQEEAQAKLQTLSEIRAEEQSRLAAESEKISADINAEQRKLDVMEATGQTDTDQYVQAKAAYDEKAAEATQKIDEITQRIADYSAPLTLAPVGTRTDVQNEYVVKRGDQEIGAFPTLQAAELKLREIDPDTFKQAEETARAETDDRVQQLKQTLTPMLERFGLKDVGLNIVEKIENDAGGRYLDSLIDISLREQNPVQTLRHESLHALKDLGFFTPQQYKALEERANKQWIKEYLQDQTAEIEVDGKPVQMSRLDAYKRLGYSQEAIVEEAIADAFGAYARGATPPPGMIAALFKKLKNFFMNFGQALRGAGFESADDVFQRVERGELKSRKANAEAIQKPKKEKLSLPQAKEKPSEGRAYKLDIERETRKVAESAFLTEEEQASVLSDAEKIGLTEEETEQIIEAIKEDKKRYPASEGWADLKVIGIDSKTDDDGNTIPGSQSPKYAAIAYAYNVPPGSTKAPMKVNPAWLKRVTGEFQSLIEDIYKRAAAGDANAKNIIAHQTWYKNVAATLRQEYGGFGDTLADLLGATSPNTPVDTNWRFSIDVMRRFVRGDFDAEMQKFVKYLDTGESVSKYPSKDKIRQISGKLYGMNSTNAMLALADMWRAIKPGQAPKARNFALNLIGQSNMATIDVWAARMLRRAANMVPGASFDRIPPPAEQGVSGTWNADATKVTGAFGFGAEVMQNVSDNLAKKGIVVAPPDLQAIAWFAEKELWGKKGWTTKTGEGGSFEENIEAQPTERFIAGHSVQIGSEKPQQKTVLDAQKRIQTVLKKDEGVLAYRVMQTSGLYGNEVEASFDTEIVVDKGKFDPEDLIKELASISKKNNQWDIFVSRVVGVNEESANARPGVEIYFKTPQDMAKIMPVLDRFTSKGQDGFTLAVDPRADDGTNQYIGVRLQYVPEISMRWDEGLRQELLAPGGLERVLKDKAELLENIAADVSVMDGVAHAAVAKYDTLVIGKENYDDYIGGRVTEEDQTIGGQSWFGQPVRTHVKRAVARLQGYQGQVGEGGVSGIGQEPPSGSKLSLRAPASPAFKQWFGDSKIVDDEGKPKVMYHGLAKDTTDFTRKTERGAPIFLTDDSDFAAKFASDSYLQVAAHPEKYLTQAQMGEGEKKAISAIRKDYGKDSFGKEMIASIQEGSPNPEAREYLQKEYVTMLPSGPHIMPLYVRAERPFDYENASHVRQVAKWYKDNIGSEYVPIGRGNMVKASNLPAILKDGQWEAIETDDVQEAIKSLGFDSFYVKEHGRKNLAVYQPNQVKSATGNVGTYSRESNDVRYSLKNVAFPSAEEAKKAVAATSVPKTDEFKLFIAGNQWVDEDGGQKVFYHGTASEFFEFTPAGKASAIYLADTPEEAEAFGKIAEDRLRQQIYRALTKDEKVDFFQGIVDAKVESGSMTEKEGADFMRQVKRKAPEFGDFGDLERETRAALIDLSPTRTAIMPLYARAETPFDFRNPDHVAQVAQAVRRPDAKLSEEFKQEAREMGAPTEYPDQWYRGLPGLLKQGYLTTIEQEPVQTAIRRLGFDGYVARRNRNSPVVYAVYKPEQVKSATGNLGEYGRESKDVRYSLRSFNKEDLPQKGRDYTLPQDTLLYHGAYKERAERIEEMGSVLLSRPPMRVSGGTIDEGGLIFFGDEDTARKFAENRADPMAVEGARQAGVERLTGKVFETATDRPYKLINRNYKINAKEAKALTEALGLPEYKALDAGDSLGIATGRALDYGRSTIDRYEVTTRTGQRKETIGAPWPVIFRTLGVDGFYDSLGVALTADNGIKLIGKDGKLEKYSLPTIPQQITDRIGETTTKAQRKTVIQNIIEAITPTSAADFRAKYLNRYNQASVYDKKRAEQMGGAALLADQSAESAALMSDLAAGVAASAMGYDDRRGGIPVLRNGFTTIDRSVKGLVPSLAPLAVYNDPVVYQRYQYWAMVKRGQRLNSQGKLTGIDTADVAFAKVLEQKHPEFVSVQKDLIAFNNGLVQYMVDTGVLSKERGQMYTKYADYIPFYRQMDGGETLGPNLFQSLSGVKPPKMLKGADVAEAPIADFLETMVRNTQSSIQAGMKNYAAQRVINVALQVKAPGMGAERLNFKSNAPDVINVLEKGNLVSYRTADPLLVNAMMSLNQSEIPFIGFLSAPADLLRSLVTKEPGFMMANILRDSLSAWVTSGVKMTPIAGTVINFGKAIARKSPGFEALQDAGIIGGYEFSDNVEKSGFKLEDDLARKAGKKDPILLRPFTSVWDALEKGTTASDSATRALIYERVLKETGNEAEALYRSLEVMNFHRKGSSPLIRILTAAVPFFNARLQGLDLFYRASTGNMNNKDAKAIQRQFLMRGGFMAGLSVAYWFMVSDDEEYKKQEQETKDNNWIIPSIGAKIPIPFEVGVLFKVVPERIAAYLYGNDTGEDLKKSMIRSVVNTFAFNPIPQTIKPVLEAYVDFNFFTMRPILGQGMKDIEPEFQVGPSTSKVATGLAQSLGLSPIKVDHILKGYTGTIGMYLIDTVDAVLDQFGNSPKPTKRFEQLPVIKRFVADPEARGYVTQFYELKDAVETTVRTMNLLEKTGQTEEYVKYVLKNQGHLALKDDINNTERKLTELRQMRVAVRSSGMGGDEKRDALLAISKMESALTSNIQTMKKAISSVQ